MSNWLSRYLLRAVDMLAEWPRAIVGDRSKIKHILGRSDTDALRGDWEAVGKDLSESMRKFDSAEELIDWLDED